MTTNITKENNLETETPSILAGLLLCTKHGLEAEVKVLLSKAKPDEINKALIRAAKHNQIELAKLFLAKGANINYFDRIFESALCQASHEGHIQMVQLLLDNQADIHLEDDLCLARAASAGHYEICRILIEKGAIVKGNVALAWAVKNKTPEGIRVVKLLLDSGADPRQKDSHGNNPLGELIYMNKTAHYEETIKILLDYGATPNIDHGQPMYDVVRHDDYDLLKILIDAGLKLNTYKGQGLKLAVENKNYRIAKLLIDSGANPNIPKASAIDLARKKGDQRMIDILMGPVPN